jgi:hypothetical protein
MIEFPISGVETYWWLPLLVAFGISLITSSAGISGAFLLLPFQISFLGFTTPAVTPTNLLFNSLAIPSGVYRFYREKRMVWPLVWTIITGAIPGLVLGVFIRVRYLPDPKVFKFFVGLILLVLALRILADILRRDSKDQGKSINKQDWVVKIREFSHRRIIYYFQKNRYQLPTVLVFSLSAVVGTVGGIYGIGGGAILAPILVIVFSLPIHTIAGAALCSTFINSLIGVLFYLFLAPVFVGGQTVTPDWHLGILLGIGGSAGIYLGARIQKHLPARLIKLILGIIMVIVSGKYIMGYLID